ncbi:uncharacterized protein LOC110733968 [Chenopodium quinoa]|uniref:uncharacterized protein LOC110733968 n=1 Tax=Chenopodium quinoa TaxID=63459 RepID=UPI000B783F6B|nr:uncharacterized protein LOC110733968 [Chenopodium quinoa]
MDGQAFLGERQTRSFPGSLLFLMLLYVDQFVIEEVRAKRETPVLKGWTTNMLSSREKLEIFKGRLGVFYKNQKLVGPSGSKQPKLEQSDPIHTKNEEIEQDPKKKCLMELATASTNLVLAYMDFSEKHETAVKYFPNNEKIQKLKEDAMTVCDEQKMSSKALTEDISLSFSQDEQYWQDPAVIEAWDRFSKISGNDKHAESTIYARVDQLIESEPIDITKIAAECVDIASGIPDVEDPSVIIQPKVAEHVFKKLGESSTRYSLRSSVAKGCGTPSFSLGISSQDDSQEKSPSIAPTDEPVVAPVSAQVGASKSVDDADAVNAQEDPIAFKRKGDAENESCIPKKRKVQPSLQIRSPFKSRIINIYTPLTAVQKGVMDSFFHEKKNRL